MREYSGYSPGPLLHRAIVWRWPWRERVVQLGVENWKEPIDEVQAALVQGKDGPPVCCAGEHPAGEYKCQAQAKGLCGK